MIGDVRVCLAKEEMVLECLKALRQMPILCHSLSVRFVVFGCADAELGDEEVEHLGEYGVGVVQVFVVICGVEYFRDEQEEGVA